MKLHLWALIVGVAVFVTIPASADLFSFSTGSPDGLMGTLSRPASPGKLETETADDFVLTATTTINQATITGLLPAGSPLSSISNVEIELYHIFPTNSTNPPSGNVPTRVNSPAHVEIAPPPGWDRGDSELYRVSPDSSFAVANTVMNGIHKIPNQTTGGEGSARGEEVSINITFNTPIVLPADHYFFRPEVGLANGDFLWLSAPRPAFVGDLQSWIRNSDLAPDWLRVGTDIVGGSRPPTFNAAFSLEGNTVPEPSTLLLLGSGLVALAGIAWRQQRG